MWHCDVVGLSSTTIDAQLSTVELMGTLHVASVKHGDRTSIVEYNDGNFHVQLPASD
jgi:hypothetical protein